MLGQTLSSLTLTKSIMQGKKERMEYLLGLSLGGDAASVEKRPRRRHSSSRAGRRPS
jgi:hypothetical protein